MKTLALALLIASVLAVPSTAQVVARQGTTSQNQPEEFTSPMVLELPLKDLVNLSFDTGRDFKEVSRFYCDDTSIKRLLLTKKRGSRKSGATVFDLKGSIGVRPSHDRLAALRFDLVNGEKSFGSSRIAGINAEEGKVRVFNSEISLSPQVYEALFSPPESALLRVTLTVVDND